MSWLGVFGGFFGVILIMQPTAQGLQDLGTLWVLACGTVVAVQMILNRRLGRDINPWLTSMWGAGTALLLLTPFLPLTWVDLTLDQLLLLLLLGLLAAASQTLFAIAFARAPAAELAPFTYSEIVAAIVIGLVFFGTLPNLISWVGIAVITCRGVLVAHAQTRR